MSSRRHPKTASKSSSRTGNNSRFWWRATAAAVTAGLAAALLPWRSPPVPHARVLSVLPNGGGEAVMVDEHTWHATLHARYPDARRIGLWGVAGIERAWTEIGKERRLSETSPFDAGEQLLYAVVDEFPFVWPASDEPRAIDVGDAQVELRMLSDSPRVFLADGVLSVDECAAVRRLGEPLVKESVTLVRGADSVPDQPHACPLPPVARATVGPRPPTPLLARRL